VHGARTNGTLRAIYGTSLALGEQLGMQVVAEGVEDQEDWDYLRQTGCDTAQGYFIARPMPGEDLPDWIDAWKRERMGTLVGPAPAFCPLEPTLTRMEVSAASQKQQAETVQAVRLAQRTMAALPERELQVFSFCEPLSDAGGDVFRCLRQAILDGPFPEFPIAVLVAHWEPRTGRLHVLNAGNPHALWQRKQLGTTQPIDLNGTPLGLFQELMVQEKVLMLDPGDRVLFSTDGLFDIPSVELGPFREQVPRHWAGTAALPVGQALGVLCGAARRHGRFRDDVLVVGLEQPRWAARDASGREGGLPIMQGAGMEGIA
jgi:hypothetical protein